MNFKRVVRILGITYMIVAAFMLPCIGLSIYDGEQQALVGFTLSICILAAVSSVFLWVSRNAKQDFYAREGFFTVAVAWITISVFGALPFFLSGEIPSFADAVFEAVSGVTTTGASVVSDMSVLSRTSIYWRCFLNWLGGMGILVFLLAVIPAARGEGNTLHILRAESTGPSVSKMVPKMRDHAITLYGIYILMTIFCFVSLLIGGMPLFHSICISFATAGTGGFATKPDSLASFAPHLQMIVAVFMALFGINFNIYYLIIMRRFKTAVKNTELWVYLGIVVFSIALITANIASMFKNMGDALLQAGFTVSSVITTTGFADADFAVWPQFSRVILLILMLTGASAGSTAGGIKVIRTILLAKFFKRELRQRIHPRAVKVVKVNGHAVSDEALQGLHIFMLSYAFLLVLSVLVISIDNFSMETNISAVVSCLSNVGPALGIAGPYGSYADFSVLSKVVLTANMLLGRLEFIPLLIFFDLSAWRRAY